MLWCNVERPKLKGKCITIYLHWGFIHSQMGLTKSKFWSFLILLSFYMDPSPWHKSHLLGGETGVTTIIDLYCDQWTLKSYDRFLSAIAYPAKWLLFTLKCLIRYWKSRAHSYTIKCTYMQPLKNISQCIRILYVWEHVDFIFIASLIGV